MKKNIIAVLMWIISGSVIGQFNPEDFKDMKFRNIGPAGMSGRITAIDVDLSDQDRIFIGSASGGLWLSENGGISWKPIFDDQPYLSIGSIAINQNNPDEIWVGTGEGNPRNSINLGGGIFKSLDGGKTWKSMGLDRTKAIHRIIINHENPEIVYAGVIGSPWGDHPERGVFRTKNGGETWEKILYVNERTGVADMVADPTNPNKILVAMWDHRRTPWDFVSGGEGSGLYLTYDGGNNWKKLSTEEGLPKGDLGRIGLSFAPSKPKIVYALIEAKENGLYKSTDGGENWKLVQKENIGGRPFYYHELYVDPKNENRIFNLHTYVTRSEDGGKTFDVIADYGNGVHPDHHAFWISPTDPQFIIDGNDGGANISRDGGDTWDFIDNIPVGQFYHVNVDNDFPYNVYGGMQDNGSWIGPAYVLKSGGIRNYDWQELYFGDGFDVVPDVKDSRYGYAMSQGGNVGRYDRITGRTQFIKPQHPDHEKLRYNWNAAIAQDPFNDCGVYYGSQFVHYSDDCGNSWVIKSPDLTTNDTSKQHQDKSGGLTIDATNAENHTTILAIAPSPLEQNLIYVGTDDGNLQITRDGGKSWKNIANKLPDLPAGSWIPQIRVSSRNAGEAFVVANNYRRNDFQPYAYHTKDYGNSWTRIVDGRQVSHFVCSILQDSEEPNLIFLGTDGGLFVSFDYGKNWTHWQEGFPNVQIRDLAIQEDEGDLVLGTFGRAFWVLDDLNPLRKIAASGEKILAKEFLAFNSPPAYLVETRSYDGIRFNAQGDFVGDNRNMGGARLSLWVKPEKEKKDKKDKVSIQILNENGDTIRTFSRELDYGLNRIMWGLERNGIEFPSRNPRKPDADPPGGPNVLPGNYHIIYKYNDRKDSTTVEVKMDPRINISSEDMLLAESLNEEYHATVEEATAAFNKLTKAKSTLKLIQDILKAQQDTSYQNLSKTGKQLDTEIDSLIGLYMMPEGLKGIQRNPDLLVGVLRSVRSYLGAWPSPNQNARVALDRAVMETNKTVTRVDQFFNQKWSPFQSDVSDSKLDLFSGMQEKRE